MEPACAAQGVRRGRRTQLQRSKIKSQKNAAPRNHALQHLKGHHIRIHILVCGHVTHGVHVDVLICRCSCGSPKATAAKRQQHGNTAPVDDDLGRKDSRIRKPRLHGAPHLVRHHVCLSVCSGLMVLFVRSHEAAAQSLSDLLRSTPGHHGHCGHLLSSTHHRVANTLNAAVDRLAPAPTRTWPRPKAGPNPRKTERNSKLKVQTSNFEALRSDGPANSHPTPTQRTAAA